MRSILAMMMLGAAACGTPPEPKALPPDLPPPEYETPRGYDLDGSKTAPKKAPEPAPSAAPAAPAPAPAPPAPKP